MTYTIDVTGKMELPKNEEFTNPQWGIMVDLGWVPSEHKKEIQATDEPITPVDTEVADLKTGIYVDNQGFVYKNKFSGAEDEVGKGKYVDLVAVVRRGEKYNPLVGNVNFEKNNLLQFVDLELMSRIFLFTNPAYTRQAYLERIVDTLEETGTHILTYRSTGLSYSCNKDIFESN